MKITNNKSIKNKLLSASIVVLVSAGILGWTTFAWNPSLTNINVNNGDILAKDVINNLQGNIQKVYNWIKWGFTTNWDVTIGRTLHLKDVFRRWGKNLVIWDDTYLSDVDIADTLGIYWLQHNDRAWLRFGSDWWLLFSDNGRFGINKTNPDTTLDVNGQVKWRDSVVAQHNNNNHYGWLWVYRWDGKRWFYIGRWNGGNTVDFSLDYATNLNFDGGGNINFYDTPVTHKTIEVRDVKWAIDQRYDTDRLYIWLRHLGRDNNPIEIRTEDVNDDWIILTSNWHDVANFKKAWVVIDSRDISLKASWTNKWLRIKSDGSVCMGACW